MRIGVVYESLFGDTREIAEAIAAGIREADPAVDLACSPAADAGPQLAQADLLIVGAPTHFLGLPSRRSRVMQLRYRNDSGTWYITGPVPRLAGNIAGSRPCPPRRAAVPQPRPGAPAGVREWLEGLPQAAGTACAAAFDTRLDKLMSGSAAREIAHRLRTHGYQLVARPEGFSVADFEGPIAEGERERARRWGVAACRAARQQACPPGRRSLGDRSLHQPGNFLLHLGAPVLEGVRHRPHVAVVEVGRFLESQSRVPVIELARVLEEDDDLPVRVRIGRHPVPRLRQEIRGGGGHGYVHALGSPRSSGAIPAIASRTACSPSAFLAPFLPSARNSAARAFIAACSSAVNPPDSARAFSAGIRSLPSAFRARHDAGHLQEG